MANSFSTQAEKINAPATYGVNKPSEERGRIRSNWFQHTCESEGIGENISLTKLPAGARVVGIKWASDDLSSGSATLAIGDSADTDRLVSSVAVGAGAIGHSHLVLRTPTTETPDIGFGYTYSADTWIIATVATAALNTGKLWGQIEYVCD